jgi:hypothetical protein
LTPGRVAPRRLTPGRLTPATPGRLTPPLRSRLRFTLSEAATVSLTNARELAGRLRGNHCVKPTRALRRAKRCTRLQRVGAAVKVAGRADANSVPFTGRGLKPGAYQLTLAPTDAAGHQGKPSSARFAIVARRKRH